LIPHALAQPLHLRALHLGPGVHATDHRLIQRAPQPPIDFSLFGEGVHHLPVGVQKRVHPATRLKLAKALKVEPRDLD
jgi:hypothetical protein